MNEIKVTKAVEEEVKLTPAPPHSWMITATEEEGVFNYKNSVTSEVFEGTAEAFKKARG